MASSPSAPTHLSYSAIDAWLRCGKAFQLLRVIGVPEQPAYALAGGRAVHSCIEAYERQQAALTAKENTK